MKIIPLAVPTPFYIGDVNVFLIKDNPLTLIDVGPKTPEAMNALREKLGANGVKTFRYKKNFADTRARRSLRTGKTNS